MTIRFKLGFGFAFLLAGFLTHPAMADLSFEDFSTPSELLVQVCAQIDLHEHELKNSEAAFRRTSRLIESHRRGDSGGSILEKNIMLEDRFYAKQRIDEHSQTLNELRDLRSRLVELVRRQTRFNRQVATLHSSHPVHVIKVIKAWENFLRPLTNVSFASYKVNDEPTGELIASGYAQMLNSLGEKLQELGLTEETYDDMSRRLLKFESCLQSPRFDRSQWHRFLIDKVKQTSGTEALFYASLLEILSKKAHQ